MVVNSMGRRRRVPMPIDSAAKYRARCRAWSRHTDKNRKAARAAVARANRGGSMSDAVEKVRQCSMDTSSEARLAAILNLLADAPAEVFWPVLEYEWPACDATWYEQPRLLALLRRHAARNPLKDMSHEGLLASLPDPMEVYRGCSRPRVPGISWSICPEVAQKFAHGHRFIAVPDPVIASAMIPKANVFMATGDRDEAEILLDPASLIDLKIGTFEGSK